MRRTCYSLLDQNPPPPSSADCEAQPADTLLTPEEEADVPTWANLRAKILSFTRGRSRSPTLRSPSGSRSPVGRSPTRRSPASRSPTARSPTRHSPVRSPTSRSPPPLRSPTQRWPPPQAKKGPFSRGASRESPAASASADASDSQQGRRNSSGSKVKRCLKKAFSLNLEGGDGVEETATADEEPESPPASTPGGRKVKLKLRSSPGEQVMEMTQLEEDEEKEEEEEEEDEERALAAAAARGARKWSYQGAGSPASPVEAPKRHSFSTAASASGRSGIVVSNTDLASLLRPATHRLTPPGPSAPGDARPAPAAPPQPPPAAPNPRARGRSQSIAACGEKTGGGGGGGAAEGPQAPITIRRTDCDYVSAPLLAAQHAAAAAASSSSEEDEGDEDEREAKLLWDSSGSTIDAGLLGSVIEQFLKTTKEEEEVASSMTGLQVK